jgi:IMP dehydrogenase/GMP reductase
VTTDEIQVSLTFDDVLLRPSYSDVQPAEVDVTTRLLSAVI